MTGQKQLKARIRERMAKTGERYATARSRFVTGPRVEVDHGWMLRGGTDPDAACLANLLAHRGIVGSNGPLSEALVFGMTGGIGAGYILWEFQRNSSVHLTLGFGHSWNYIDRRLIPALSRLGLAAEFTRTGGEKASSSALAKELDEGNPVILWPDRFRVGYWGLPEHLDGHGGHPVIAYARAEGRVHLDDRNHSPLTVTEDQLSVARARVGSYKNAMLTVRPHDVVLDDETVASAVRGGLETVVEHLSSSSSSFSLPTWQKWSRLLVDTKDKKGWPSVFSDGTDLLNGLVGTWDAIAPASSAGGHLRGLFAAFLAEAAVMLQLPPLEEEATRWQEIAGLWGELANAALPQGNELFDEVRGLTVRVSGSVSEGDEGSAERAEAATALWSMYEKNRNLRDFDSAAAFGIMSAKLAEIFAAETEAIARLGAIIR